MLRKDFVNHAPDQLVREDDELHAMSAPAFVPSELENFVQRPSFPCLPQETDMMPENSNPTHKACERCEAFSLPVEILE